MRIGSEELLNKYGSPLRVAEALLKGELSSFEQRFVGDVVGATVLEAAKFRLQPPTIHVSTRPTEHAVLTAAQAVAEAWDAAVVAGDPSAILRSIALLSAAVTELRKS